MENGEFDHHMVDEEQLGSLARGLAREHTQATVALALGVSQPHVGRAYRGKATDLALRIVRHYGARVVGPFYQID